MKLYRQLALYCAIITLTWLGSGCTSTNGDSSSFAQWANSPSCTCRIAIASEHSSRSDLRKIANQYGAPAFGGPSNGPVIDTMSEGFTHTLGAADPKSEGLVRQLANMLGIINATKKNWNIFVMRDGVNLFSQTIKAMPDDGLSTASGTIHLIGWQKAKEVEDAIHRISNGTFKVVYE